jgi:hypothetical protein
MLLLLRSPTLTGVAAGGVMVRPTTAMMRVQAVAPALRTTWIVRLTLAPPIENPPPDVRPTLLTERVVGPGVG